MSTFKGTEWERVCCLIPFDVLRLAVRIRGLWIFSTMQPWRRTNNRTDDFVAWSKERKLLFKRIKECPLSLLRMSWSRNLKMLFQPAYTHLGLRCSRFGSWVSVCHRSYYGELSTTRCSRVTNTDVISCPINMTQDPEPQMLKRKLAHWISDEYRGKYFLSSFIVH